MSTTGPGPARLRWGPVYLLRGFALWRTRPGLMLLGMVPALIVLVALLATLLVLLARVGDLVTWMTPFMDGWAAVARDLLRLGLEIGILAAAVILASLTFTAATLAVGDPFYGRIWRATEELLGGPVPDHGVSFWRSLWDAVVLLVAGLLAGVALVLTGLVPVVGTIGGLLLGLLVAGQLLAGELLARPLEARGMDRRARRALLDPHRGRTLSFGVATQVFFLVPLGAILVMPAAVAGATMLARDVLDAEA